MDYMNRENKDKTHSLNISIDVFDIMNAGERTTSGLVISLQQ